MAATRRACAAQTRGAGSPGDTRGALRASAAIGSAILAAIFPESLHSDIRDAVGLWLDRSSTGHDLKVARRRDPAFPEKVLVAYEYRCAVCGYDGQMQRTAVGIDAAHVRWWQAQGPRGVDNAVALCSLHHELLDAGAVRVTAGYCVQVSSRFIGRSDAAAALVLAYAGRPIVPPQAGQPVPHPHVGWHEREVFRGPARLAAGDVPR